jgi:hypothetical protein
MMARRYYPQIGRFGGIDPQAESFAGMSTYTGMANSPAMYTDPDGELPFLVVMGIGALVGGGINLGAKFMQGKVTDWKSGLAAFGVGAVAGAVGVMTGGASLGASATALGAGGFISGFGAGALSGFYSSAFLGVGNAAFFGDPLSMKDLAVGTLFGGATGGLANGLLAKSKGLSFWDGKEISRKITALSPRSLLTPKSPPIEKLDIKQIEFSSGVPKGGGIQPAPSHLAPSAQPTPTLIARELDEVVVTAGKNYTTSLTEQAAQISRQIGKNSVNIRTNNRLLHYDLQGAPHRGVPTPHVQQSLPNMNPKTGTLFWNKDRIWVERMTQEDLRIIRNYLKRR